MAQLPSLGGVLFAFIHLYYIFVFSKHFGKFISKITKQNFQNEILNH